VASLDGDAGGRGCWPDDPRCGPVACWLASGLAGAVKGMSVGLGLPMVAVTVPGS